MERLLSDEEVTPDGDIAPKERLRQPIGYGAEAEPFSGLKTRECGPRVRHP